MSSADTNLNLPKKISLERTESNDSFGSLDLRPKNSDSLNNILISPPTLCYQTSMDSINDREEEPSGSLSGSLSMSGSPPFVQSKFKKPKS
jgi:hypothetical protein